MEMHYTTTNVINSLSNINKIKYFFSQKKENRCHPCPEEDCMEVAKTVIKH